MKPTKKGQSHPTATPVFEVCFELQPLQVELLRTIQLEDKSKRPIETTAEHAGAIAKALILDWIKQNSPALKQ